MVFLTSLVIADSPALGDPAADVRQWFEDNQAQVAWTTWSGGLSLALFFLLFASGLRSLLGPADAGNEGVWSRFSFAGAITMFAIGGSKAVFWAVLAQEDILSAASDETVKTLFAFDSVAVSTILPWGVAVFLLGASVVILQSGVMAKWLGWLGLLVTLLFAIGTLWPSFGDQESFFGILTAIGFIGFLIWTLGAAVSMIRSNSPSAS